MLNIHLPAGGGDSEQAAAVSAARALSAGGEKAKAFAAAVALAISQTGCPTLQPTLASK